MVFDRSTFVYVPIFYILMTHKTEDLYWQVIQQVICATDWKFEPGYTMNDFEKALINALEHHFLDTTKKCCLFHWKQAIRRYLITQCKFDKKEIKYALSLGVLDLLTVIPQDEVVIKGIPFVRSLIEDGVSDVELSKWEKFWKYFDKQWIPLLDKWNICDEDGDIINVINRTNNGVESYNR